MSHIPVLLQACIDALAIQADGIYLDGTFGRGGHSGAILERLGPEGQLIGGDRDIEAITHGQAQSAFQAANCQLIHASFAQLPAMLKEQGLSGQLQGIFLDLGVSSPQLDQAERGFSFQQDGPLDMRMDQSQGMSAAEWLASAQEKDIADVLWQLGEERFARRIAKTIVMQREAQPLQTTKDLVALIDAAVPKKDKHKHPATRSFQAIRMHVNDELGELRTFLEAVPDLLAPGGRLAILTFHSLEDRIVKQWMRSQSQAPQVPAKLPIQAQALTPPMTLITRRPVVADEQEICHNPRSRSAKLRVIEKIHAQTSTHLS